MNEELKLFIETTQAAIDVEMKDCGRTMKGLLLLNLEQRDEEGRSKVAYMPLPSEFTGTDMGALAQRFRPLYDVVALIAEAWVGRTKDVAPSKDPEKTESVIMLVYNRKEKFMYTSKMNRISDEQVIMGEWELWSNDDMSGPLVDKPYQNPPSWN